MVSIEDIHKCSRSIANIVIRYLTSCNSELRDDMEPMDCLNINVIIDNNIPVGYLKSSIHDNKYIIELIEIFPMFRGNKYAKNTVLELEGRGKEVIISHPLSFTQWISIMGIIYWKKKADKLGSRKLYDLMTYSSNGNYDQDKYLSAFLRKLAFGSYDDKYKTWDEYISLIKQDSTIVLSKPSLDRIHHEYYVIDNGIVLCKMQYNGVSRPLTSNEIFILDVKGIKYCNRQVNILFQEGHMLLHDYLNMLGLSTRNVPNIILNKDMTTDRGILYWDRLYSM